MLEYFSFPPFLASATPAGARRRWLSGDAPGMRPAAPAWPSALQSEWVLGNESIAGSNAGIMTAARAGSRPFDFHGDGQTPTAAQGENSRGGSQSSELVGGAHCRRPAGPTAPQRGSPGAPAPGGRARGAGTARARGRAGGPGLGVRAALGAPGACGRGCSRPPPGGTLPDLPSPDTDLVPPHPSIPISPAPQHKSSGESYFLPVAITPVQRGPLFGRNMHINRQQIIQRGMARARQDPRTGVLSPHPVWHLSTHTNAPGSK